MRSGSPRLAGVLLTALLLVMVMLVWSPRRPAGPDGILEPRPGRGGRLTAAVRALPDLFDPLEGDGDDETRLLRVLTQGTLVRVNPATLEIEPWLAERWSSSPDGRSHTLVLRSGVAWSDGVPFTAADVVFSLEAFFDGQVASPLAAGVAATGGAVHATAADARTVVLTQERPSGAWLHLLDGIPLLPRHHLESRGANGTLATAWAAAAGASPPPGLGPFILRNYDRERGVLLERNVHYWRVTPEGESLPYLDEIALEVIDDDAEQWRRLEAGALDVPAGTMPSDEYAAARQRELQGLLTIVDLGVARAADALWFCLRPEAAGRHPAAAFVQRREFRQALSHAVDREALAHAVFGGHAVPVWGPLTPGHRGWFTPDVPRYPPDAARARELLAAIDLRDRTGDGVIEDARGVQARITVATARGVARYERATAALVEATRDIGVALDIELVEADTLARRVSTCDAVAAYGTPLAADLDPAGALARWLDPDAAHPWHSWRPAGGTGWERRIDALLAEQVTASPQRRRAIVHEVQQLLGEEVSVLFVTAPRAYAVHRPQVLGVTPAPIGSPILWSADTLAVRASTAGQPGRTR